MKSTPDKFTMFAQLEQTHVLLKGFAPSVFHKHVPEVNTIFAGFDFESAILEYSMKYLPRELWIRRCLINCVTEFELGAESIYVATSQISTPDRGEILVPFQDGIMVGYANLLTQLLKSKGYPTVVNGCPEKLLPMMDSFEQHEKALASLNKDKKKQEGLVFQKADRFDCYSSQSIDLMTNHYLWFLFKEEELEGKEPSEEMVKDTRVLMTKKMEYLNRLLREIPSLRLYVVTEPNRVTNRLLAYVLLYELEDQLYWVEAFVLRDEETLKRGIGNYIIFRNLKYAYVLKKPLNLGLAFFPYKDRWVKEITYRETI